MGDEPIGATLADDHLRSVGQIHALAVLEGRHPDKAVAEHFGVSRRTARYWVAETRRRGLMPVVTMPGKP